MKKNHQFKRILVSVAILATFLTYLHAFIYLNDFEPPVNGKDLMVEGKTIEGTSLFLQSNSDAFLLLNEVETGYGAVFDFSKATLLTESALSKLKRSRENYAEIFNLSASGTYDPAVLGKLVKFNYAKFAESNRLNSVIMKKVESFLGKGNITGVYQEVLNNIDDLVLTLEDIHRLLGMGVKPEIDLFWSLLQQYSESILFGNYATLVFNNI